MKVTSTKIIKLFYNPEQGGDVEFIENNMAEEGANYGMELELNVQQLLLMKIVLKKILFVLFCFHSLFILCIFLPMIIQFNEQGNCVFFQFYCICFNFNCLRLCLLPPVVRSQGFVTFQNNFCSGKLMSRG